VVEKFWRDPVFPLVPSEAVIRRAIFDALRPDDDGVTWELVSSSGEHLAVASPEQLALHSPDQQLRLAQPGGQAEELTLEGAEPVDAARTSRTVAPPVPSAGGPTQYLVHEIEIRNRSLTDRKGREDLYQLLSQLADVIDPVSGRDVQVASIKVELNAAAGALEDVESKAHQAGARWSAHEEDF